MATRTPFRRIGVEEADALVTEKAPVILDVRDAGSYGAAHMEGARNINFNALSEIIGGTAKASPVLIYCYHGNASQEFAQTLSDFGFAEVYSLDGGYEAWESWEKFKAAARKPAAPLDAALQEWLVGQGFPADGLNATVANGMTPAMSACCEGRGEVLARLIAAGADLAARNGDGNTALWLACVGDHLDLIDMLVDAGIDIDNRNDNGATALMYAASAGKAEVVGRLLARGADPKPETLDGFSALDLASTLECLTLLRAATRKTVADPA